uniref:Uncharacterized protein n=1 Tax=Ciona intestinalis TaxID=7719 RepID=H2XYX5_CIOIN
MVLLILQIVSLKCKHYKHNARMVMEVINTPFTIDCCLVFHQIKHIFSLQQLNHYLRFTELNLRHIDCSLPI